ncbi:hypothetical protein V1478_001633 [Vespula squamosa]|uniref:Uncharacterized protein n=2 Tax=Vespula squamosa TaxID=30214 RepID=A0ABD2C205_VESSQ
MSASRYVNAEEWSAGVGFGPKVSRFVGFWRILSPELYCQPIIKYTSVIVIDYDANVDWTTLLMQIPICCEAQKLYINYNKPKQNKNF